MALLLQLSEQRLVPTPGPNEHVWISHFPLLQFIYILQYINYSN